MGRAVGSGKLRLAFPGWEVSGLGNAMEATGNVALRQAGHWGDSASFLCE